MAPAPAARSLSGAILVGGRGRRMGADKASLVVRGRRLLDRAMAAVGPLCDELLVVGRTGQAIGGNEPGAPVRRVSDRIADGGPLAGLHVALLEARWPLVLVVPVDMPLLSGEVLRLLVSTAEADEGADAVVLGSSHGTEPLPGVYRARCAAVAGRLLNDGERRMHAFLDAITVQAIPEGRWRAFDPAGRSLTNLNAPVDVEGLVPA